MTKRILLRDPRGVAAIEFAIMVPMLLALIFGIAQLGILFVANAGLHNAVGEGARLALIYPTPTDAQIRTRMLDRSFGLKPELVSGPTIARGVSNGVDYADVSIAYDVPLDFIFFRTPPIRLQQERRTYLPKH